MLSFSSRSSCGVALLALTGLSLMSLSTRSVKSGATLNADKLAKLPLSFEINRGQAAPPVRFLTRGGGYDLLLEPSEAVLHLQNRQTGAAAELRLQLINSNPTASIEGLDEQPGRSNYFIGNDPRRWRTDIPHFAKLRQRAVYPGIDLLYYGQQQQLEYDFVVAPGAEPSTIRLRFAGAQKIELDPAGNLLLHTNAGVVRHQRPVIYQEVNGSRRQVEGGFVIRRWDEVGFKVAAWERRLPLVIDPVLSYAAALGDAHYVRMAVDAEGSFYLSGLTRAQNFPVAADAARFQRGPLNRDVAFVTKINAAGTALLYSTFLGGYEYTDLINGLAVDAAGNAYLAGFAGSRDFPVTAGALQTKFNGPGQVGNSFGGDGFVAKLNPSGTALLYSTFLGGAGGDYGNGIAVDQAGNAYVTGNTGSSNFPLSPDAPQRSITGFSGSGFITKLNAAGSAVVWSTFAGRATRDSCEAIAVDAEGNAYVTGESFPNILAVKVDKGGKSFAYFRTISASGGSTGFAVAVDGVGQTHLTGRVYSASLPVTMNALQRTFGGGSTDAFVARLNPAGEVAYLSYLGGSGNEIGYGIALANNGNVYLTGNTDSPNFPLTPDAFQPNPVPNVGVGYYSVAFITQVNANGALGYSSFHGLGGDEGRSVAVRQVAQGLPPTVFFAGSGFWLSRPPGALFILPTPNGTTGAFIAKLEETAASGGADLEVTLAPNDRIYANSIVAYAATVKNVGAVSSVGPISLRFNVPNVSFRRPPTGNGWSCFEQIPHEQGSCTFGGTLAPGESTKLLIEFFAYGNSNGNATATIANVGDANNANNQASIAIQTVNGCVQGSFVTLPNPLPPQGGTFIHTFNLAACQAPWKAISNVPWITINSGAATGNATVSYTVAPNPTSKLRGGSFTAEGLSVELSQNGAQPAFANVSAASFANPGVLAREAIVAAFGTRLATTTRAAESLPLPTELGGTTVKIKDSFGAEKLAPLFFVSAAQVNYLVPPNLAFGPATVTVSSGDGTQTSSAVQLVSISPAIFTANSTGNGVPAGVLLRVKANGSQSYEPLADYDAQQRSFVPRPIDFGPDQGAASDQLYLILFCAGVRHRNVPELVGVGLPGPSARVLYAGPQGSLVGVDQVNIELPRSLPNYGSPVGVRLYVDGLESNGVQIAVKR
jgi:uncharacterized protein (TIGR03437 family)